MGCGVCLWCRCASLSFFVRRLFVSLRFLGGLASSSRSLPPLRWGPALLFSRGAHPVCSSGSVRGFGWTSWLSSLPACWFRLVKFSRFPVVFAWSFRCLPCGPYARPLFGPLAVPPYLASCLFGVASPRL